VDEIDFGGEAGEESGFLGGGVATAEHRRRSRRR
jgi:hypothetical protein